VNEEFVDTFFGMVELERMRGYGTEMRLLGEVGGKPQVP